MRRPRRCWRSFTQGRRKNKLCPPVFLLKNRTARNHFTCPKKERAAYAAALVDLRKRRLPRKFEFTLDNAVADGVCREAEIRTRKGPTTVKRQVQVLIAVEERAIRVIEEVIAGEAELELLALGSTHREVLEQRDVSVEETGTSQDRPDIIALFARCSEGREAGAVDVLVSLEPLARITSQRRHQGEVGRAKHVRAVRLDRIGNRLAHKGCASGDKSCVAKICADGRLQIGSGLVLRNARD